MGWLGRVGWAGLLVLACLGCWPGSAMALSCPDNREASGGLCYLKPREGYTCQATLCVQNCPNGYVSSGIGTCHYAGTLTYTTRPYLTRSHSGMQRCLALFYNDCRDGYRMQVCGICSYQGAWDTTRASYDRGPGINPDMSSAFNRLSDTARATWGRLVAGIQTGLAQALAALEALAQDVLNTVVRDMAEAAVAESATANQLKSVTEGLSALQQDADALNVLKRLAVAGATGKADPQVAKDMLFVASKLGLVNNKAGIKAFGVYSQFEVVAGAGIGNTVGIAMNVPASIANPGNVDPRVFMSQGPTFGPEASATNGFGIFLIRGDVRSLNGLEVSVGVNGGVGIGGNVGVGISVPLRLPVVDVTKPEESLKNWLRGQAVTFAVGLSSGAGAGAAVSFGYGTTLQLK